MTTDHGAHWRRLRRRVCRSTRRSVRSNPRTRRKARHISPRSGTCGTTSIRIVYRTTITARTGRQSPAGFPATNTYSSFGKIRINRTCCSRERARRCHVEFQRRRAVAAALAEFAGRSSARHRRSIRAQGQVAIATHGRAFWVLDDLTVLEQLARGSSDVLFAPQTAWLTHMYGGGAFPRADSGQNPPFGATVFFNVPSNYNGGTPASLTFSGRERANHPHVPTALKARADPADARSARKYVARANKSGDGRASDGNCGRHEPLPVGSAVSRCDGR